MKELQLLKGFLITGTISLLSAQTVLAQAAPIQITNVQLKPTPKGLQVVLQTATGTVSQVVTSSYDQTLLIDLFNTQLRLPEGDELRVNNPTQDVTSVLVKRLYNNSVRVTVIGKAAVPQVEVVQVPQGVAATPTTPTQETPTPQPSESAQTPDPTAPSGENQPSESAQTPDPTVPSPETELPEQAQEDEPIEVVVSGQREGEYTAPTATTATRTDTPLRDIPQSIQVIPQKVIEDQQVTRIGEAARNVSGVVVLEGYGGSTENFVIRGFDASSILRNGFREDDLIRFSDSANIERVEVLKGPASVLYGQFDPGGVVNYVTKKPLSEPYFAGEFNVGSYNYYRPSIDISGPLTPNESVLYRLNLAYENFGSFRDFVDGQKFIAAPVLSFKLGEKTNLTLEYEYANLERTFDRGFPAEREVFNLPISRNLGEPTDSYTFTGHRPTFILEHSFNDNLRIRSGFSVSLFDVDRSNVQPRTFQLQPDRRTLRRRFTESKDTFTSYNSQTDLIGKFNTGSIKHEVLLGIEYSNISVGGFLNRNDFPSIDIFNPVYGFPKPNLLPVFDEDRNTQNWGVYVQDQIELLPNLKFLVGGRFDFVDINIEDNLINQTTNRNYDAFTPRVGIVYQPIEPVSLYASYSRSFKPNVLSRTAAGGLLDPEEGTQYEVGVKSEFLGGRLSTTLAAYNITKKNVATTDPNNLDFSIAAGEVKSRGIELDVAGTIVPGWNIVASYGYNNAFVSEDNNLPEGDRLTNAPAHTASLWTTYEIQKGNLRGLGFGAGLFFLGDRDVELPNDLQVPSYVRTDATIFYRRDNYRVGLNFKNLFDTRYYDASSGGLIYPGAPLTVLGTISVQF